MLETEERQSRKRKERLSHTVSQNGKSLSKTRLMSMQVLPFSFDHYLQETHFHTADISMAAQDYSCLQRSGLKTYCMPPWPDSFESTLGLTVMTH